MDDDRTVYGTALGSCSTGPETGHLCDGCCRAIDADRAPPVVLESTNDRVLREVDPDLLRTHEYDPSEAASAR